MRRGGPISPYKEQTTPALHRGPSLAVRYGLPNAGHISQHKFLISRSLTHSFLQISSPSIQPITQTSSKTNIRPQATKPKKRCRRSSKAPGAQESAMSEDPAKPEESAKPEELARPTYDGQETSKFFQLPQEIRNEIYSHLFFSTRFAFGHKFTSKTTCVRLQPAPNGLALLRACHRANDEIGDSWMGKVLFSFEDPMTLLDKLVHLPKAKLSKIRHLRVSALWTFQSFFPLRYRCFERSMILRMLGSREMDSTFIPAVDEALKFLPSLKLDRLTVLAGHSSAAAYESLDDLVSSGQGWKELCFISHDSTMLGWRLDQPSPFNWLLGAKRRPRSSQPSHWQSDLDYRDGADSGASVKIYRSLQSSTSRSVLNSSHREPYEQTREVQRDENGVYAEDDFLMCGEQSGKEVLVVVTRGTGAKYEMPSLPVDFGDNNKQSIASWPQCRKYLRAFSAVLKVLGANHDMTSRLEGYYNEQPYANEIDVDSCETDSYVCVEDYAWTPFHGRLSLPELRHKVCVF